MSPLSSALAPPAQPRRGRAATTRTSRAGAKCTRPRAGKFGLLPRRAPAPHRARSAPILVCRGRFGCSRSTRTPLPETPHFRPSPPRAAAPPAAAQWPRACPGSPLSPPSGSPLPCGRAATNSPVFLNCQVPRKKRTLTSGLNSPAFWSRVSSKTQGSSSLGRDLCEKPETHPSFAKSPAFGRAAKTP